MRIMEAFDFKRVDEGLGANPISFGTDPDRSNSKFAQSVTGTTYTFFVKDGKSYLVYHNQRHEVGFAANLTDNTESNTSTDYDDIRIPAANALRVFNHVIYILGEILKHDRPNRIKMAPKDPKLGRLYGRALGTESVSRELADVGYYFEGEVRGVYYITKL